MSPEVLAEGQSSVRAAFGWSTDFSLVEGSYLVDVETRTVNLEGWHSPVEGLQVGLRVPFIWRGGGDLDAFIDSFHRFFSFPRGGRERLPDDRYTIAGVNYDNSVFSFRESGFELGDATLGAKYLITPGDENFPAWSSLFEVRLPTASEETYGQNAIDLTWGALGSKRWGDLAAYTGAAYIYYGDMHSDRLTYERHHFEGFFSLEYLLADYFALELGVYGASRSVRGVFDFPGYATYIDSGAKIRLGQGTFLELLVRENPSPVEASADVTFLVALAQVGL